MQNQDQQQKIPNGERELVRADVIAQIYNVEVSIVYKWAKTGKIPSEKIQGIRRFHVPSVRQKLEGLYRISDDDLELGIFC
jgi:hypothetical protein